MKRSKVRMGSTIIKKLVRDKKYRRDEAKEDRHKEE